MKIAPAPPLDLLPPLVGRTLPPKKEGTLLGRCAAGARPALPGSGTRQAKSRFRALTSEIDLA